MTTEKAIEILIRQRDKVVDKDHYNDETWVFHTASHIKDFFGEDSTEYSFISQFKFTVIGNSAMSNEQWRSDLDHQQDKALKFIDNCIQTIKDKGLYRPPRQNFLQRLNDTWLTTILVLVLSGIGTVTFLIGQYTAGLENIELERDLKQAKDSLRLFIPPIDHITNKDTSDNTTKNQQKDSTDHD